MKVIRILLAAALLLTSFSANAQRHRRGSDRLGEFYFGLGAVAPTGEFNKAAEPIEAEGLMVLDKDHVGTSASMGIGLSFKYSFEFSVIEDQCSAGPFVGVDFAWNDIDKSVRKVFTDKSCDRPVYLNMPIMLGANGRYYFNDVIGVSAEFGIGADMAIITHQGWEKDKLNYPTSFSLAWQVGAGAYFGRHVNLSVHYYSLGTHNTTPDPNDDGHKYSKDMGALMFKLGFCW